MNINLQFLLYLIHFLQFDNTFYNVLEQIKLAFLVLLADYNGGQY